MPREKGQPKSGGRRPGSGNKATGDIKSLIRSEAPALVKLLMDIAKDKANPPQARIMATRELLDRGLGKATQPIDGNGDGGPIVVQLVNF